MWKSLKHLCFLNDFSDIGSPKVTCQNLLFRNVFLENYILAQTKNLQFSFVLHWIHLPDSQKTHSEKQWKNKQNPNAPSRHWKSPKLQNRWICNEFLKVMIGRLPGTPQVAPKRPKTYPGSSRDPKELSEGPPGPPGRPGSHETLRKSNNNAHKII